MRYDDAQVEESKNILDEIDKTAKDKIYGNNSNASQVAESISKTAPLDNSGFEIPTWGKVGLGIGGGLLVGSLLDGE